MINVHMDDPIGLEHLIRGVFNIPILKFEACKFATGIAFLVIGAGL